jgi:hypothetical protein
LIVTKCANNILPVHHPLDNNQIMIYCKASQFA